MTETPTLLLPASDEEIEFMVQRVIDLSAVLDEKAMLRARAQAAETKAKKEFAKAYRALRVAKPSAVPEGVESDDDDAD